MKSMPSPAPEQHAEHIPGFIAAAPEIFLLFPSLEGVNPLAQTSFGVGRQAVPALAHGPAGVLGAGPGVLGAGPGVLGAGPGDFGAGPGDFGAGAGLDVHFDPKSGHATLEKYTPRTAPTIAKTQHIPMTTMILALTIVNIVGFFPRRLFCFKIGTTFREAHAREHRLKYTNRETTSPVSVHLCIHTHQVSTCGPRPGQGFYPRLY